MPRMDHDALVDTLEALVDLAAQGGMGAELASLSFEFGETVKVAAKTEAGEDFAAEFTAEQLAEAMDMDVEAAEPAPEAPAAEPA